MWFPIQFLSFYLSNQLYWYIPSFTKKNLEVLRFFISTGCRARQLWLLARHGTRNPGTKAMKKMAHHLPLLREFILENHLHGSGSLCSDDRKLTETTFNGYSNKVKLLFLTVKNLQKWRFRAVVDENKYLVDEGFDELQDLGRRFQSRFDELLTRSFDNSSYIVNPIFIVLCTADDGRKNLVGLSCLLAELQRGRNETDISENYEEPRISLTVDQST